MREKTDNKITIITDDEKQYFKTDELMGAVVKKDMSSFVLYFKTGITIRCSFPNGTGATEWTKIEQILNKW